MASGWEIMVLMMHSYRSASLKQRLVKHYSESSGCNIWIFKQKGTLSLLCSTKLNVGQLLTEGAKLKQGLEEKEIVQ